MDYTALINDALDARQKAYVPYSGFGVGAALLTKGGNVYKGCNIESASYSPTNCAERTAFFKAVSEGEREFSAIAVVGAPMDTDIGDKSLGYAFPCGVCRQVMKEFCSTESFQIIVAKSPEDYEVFSLGELLPHAFGPENL